MKDACASQCRDSEHRRQARTARIIVRARRPAERSGGFRVRALRFGGGTGAREHTQVHRGIPRPEHVANRMSGYGAYAAGSGIIVTRSRGRL
jgi:hypothetical protein